MGRVQAKKISLFEDKRVLLLVSRVEEKGALLAMTQQNDDSLKYSSNLKPLFGFNLNYF